MLRFLILIFFYPVSLLSVAQFDYASELNRLHAYETDDEIKDEISFHLTEALVSDWQKSDFVLDSLERRSLKIIASPDGMLRICTWHYVLRDATSQYGGAVKYGKEVMPLHFNDSPIEDNKEYTQDNWCGGIYYDVVPVRTKKKETLYTLLAWDGNNGVTSKKIIDVLTFNRKGQPVFGASVFNVGHRVAKRVVVEYASSSSMLLEYDEEQKAIVSNALNVSEERFSEVAEFYSAGDMFNVYRLEHGKWVLYANVDLRLNKKESKDLQGKTGNASRGL